MSYSDRSKLCENPLGARLLAIMDQKRSNLAFSADVSSTSELIKVHVNGERGWREGGGGGKEEVGGWREGGGGRVEGRGRRERKERKVWRGQQ